MLGDRLKSLRKINNLTQAQICQNFKISEARYNQYENNKRNPDYEMLKEFAKFYNVSTDYLLGNETSDNINDKVAMERQALEKALIDAGYMKENEDLSNDELNRLMNFVITNKKFIKDCK